MLNELHGDFFFLYVIVAKFKRVKDATDNEAIEKVHEIMINDRQASLRKIAENVGIP